MTVYYDNPTAYRSDRLDQLRPAAEAPTVRCCSSTARGRTRSTEPVAADAGGGHVHRQQPQSGADPRRSAARVGLFARIGCWLGRRRPSDYDVE